MQFLSVRIATLAAALASVACGGDQTTTNPSQTSPGGGSFAKLQTSVFTANCAVSGCHVTESAAASGNLVLSPSVAYENLVGVRPSNLAAQRDGLKRVVAGKPDSSLLFQKIVLALAAHGNYGNVMPVGSQALSQGQVDFIRKWIEAGAPKAGEVADESLLANKTPQSASVFVPLVAPAAGKGVQIHVDSFGVRPNFERELFVYRSLGNATDIYVNRIETSMRALSHHFVLYSVDPSMAPGWPCTPTPITSRRTRPMPSGCHRWRSADGWS